MQGDNFFFRKPEVDIFCTPDMHIGILCLNIVFYKITIDNFIEIYNEKRKLVGLKPLKSVQLKANLSSMLNDNSIEDIITTLKELQYSQN